jgi:DNA-binding response OmpR family regulator
MMPVMDGWEVMTELAANPDYSQKVILVSAKASDDAQLQGWELGADEYITKPFDLDALLERVREVAARSDAESEKRRAEAISELQNL